MTFSMNAQSFTKHEIEEMPEYQPAPKGQYRCEINNCQIIDRVSQAGNKLTDFKAEVVIFMPDNSTKKAWIGFFIANSKESAQGLAQKNQNQLFDLYTNVISTKFGGDMSQFPNLNENTIHLMDGAILELGVDISKNNAKFNEIVEFNPVPSQPTYQAQTGYAVQQAPQQQAPQFQQQQAPQFQQTPAMQQAQNNVAPQGAMPPFMQTQQQG